jgi:hypothetical protein
MAAFAMVNYSLKVAVSFPGNNTLQTSTWPSEISEERQLLHENSAANA